MRVVDKALVGAEPPVRGYDARLCAVCGVRSTREKKPWCSECLVEHSAAAASVHAEVAAREAEAESCQPRLGGSLVSDVLGLIRREGPMNPALVARHVRLLQDGRARAYMNALVRLGLLVKVRIRPKSRSKQAVAYALTDKGRGALA